MGVIPWDECGNAGVLKSGLGNNVQMHSEPKASICFGLGYRTGGPWLDATLHDINIEMFLPALIDFVVCE